MKGFGVHTSMWTMVWTPEAAEKTVKAAVYYKMEFIEIALLNISIVDAKHTKSLLEKNNFHIIKFNTFCSQKLFFDKIRKLIILIYGGERGIRTLDSVATIHAFQAC